MAHSASQAHNVETRTFDVAVVGNGIIGRSVALELCRAGASCVIIGSSEAGAGWRAAAGILAPSVGERDPAVRTIFRQSLDLYPDFLDRLRTFDPGLGLLEGLIEILSAPNTTTTLGSDSVLLDASALRRDEPALLAPFGAILHRRDAAADSERIVAALGRALSANSVDEIGDGAASIDLDQSPPVVTTRSGRLVRATTIVLAAGAWSPGLSGLPRRLPVSPLKGQIIALEAPGVVTHPVMAGHVYLVPRGRELIVGATQEEAGFDVQSTDDAMRTLQTAALDYCPSLAQARVTRRWAGLRPATPDMLPIVGLEPLAPALAYACGHSRNGVLLAPLTAELVRQTIQKPPSKSPALDRFSVTRFP